MERNPEDKTEKEWQQTRKRKGAEREKGVEARTDDVECCA